MNAKHTPGPWTAHPATHRISDRDGVIVTQSFSAADARLIAAAPDLLAALRALVEVAEGYEKSDTEAAEDSGEEPYVAPRIKAARSAIARATGGGA